ncbi:S8 family serine peptidase [Xanthocytophaga agilis]|uniref:S8 family serine peptidase n=1 Tax=Xanthocytophaga agilis TaxID=3048010 RepID=A0AAE3UGX9_9BACT|nr:S8 family serine peptidase [Xanthocytophaga agilis]MDJ1505453.1 S8 family serine peptidase [Xanthocytophaga agilis]
MNNYRMRLSGLACGLFLLMSSWASAQQKYWITFKDKPVYSANTWISPQAEQNRMQQGLAVYQDTDAPVNPAYIRQLKDLGIETQVTSKWLNATSAYLDEKQLQAVKKLPFVQEINGIDSRLRICSVTDGQLTPEIYSVVLNQIGAKAFIEEGLTGKGIKVGIIDVGFYGVATSASLQLIRDENRIKDTRDFVNPSHTEDFFSMETHSDYHGAEVLQLVGGYNTNQRMEFGMATGATFYLARTDHGVRETRTEEDNWIAAIERMDSLGVRLINTSLGYAMGFSNAKENYKPSEMDGKTSKISKAAQIAADQKGMLIVVSAGNEGDDPNWRIISTPADAQGVLSIGATKAKSRDRISYSSIGPDFLPYLKPNVSCFSPNGTSFSAPVITGLAACLMEKNPKLTNKQLMRIIEKSAHLYPYGNTYIGYGVPDARKALQLVKDSTAKVNTIQEIHTSNKSYEVQTSDPDAERAVIFHKKTAQVVSKQEVLALVNSRLTLHRQSDEKRTTVDLGDEVIEIFWEDK